MKLICAKLHNGVVLPAVALGTWTIKDENTCQSSVSQALATGYRHIDTANVYGNEYLIGPLVRDYEAGKLHVEETADDKDPVVSDGIMSEVFELVDEADFRKNFRTPIETDETRDRKLFVTTKVQPDNMSPEGVRRVVAEHQKHFGREVVDLVLLHWPAASNVAAPGNVEDNQKIRIAAWMALEELHAEGKIRAIGVSNYMEKHLKPLLEDVETRKKEGDQKATIPHVNQIEINPYCDVSPDLLKLCRENHIVIESYSTLGSHSGVKELSEDPIIVEASKTSGLSPAQVMLRWALQRGYVILPRSTKKERVIENFQVGFKVLDDADIKNIAKMNKQHRFCWDPTKIN